MKKQKEKEKNLVTGLQPSTGLTTEHCKSVLRIASALGEGAVGVPALKSVAQIGLEIIASIENAKSNKEMCLRLAYKITRIAESAETAAVASRTAPLTQIALNERIQEVIKQLNRVLSILELIKKRSSVSRLFHNNEDLALLNQCDSIANDCLALLSVQLQATDHGTLNRIEDMLSEMRRHQYEQLSFRAMPSPALPPPLVTINGMPEPSIWQPSTSIAPAEPKVNHDPTFPVPSHNGDKRTPRASSCPPPSPRPVVSDKRTSSKRNVSRSESKKPSTRVAPEREPSPSSTTRRSTTSGTKSSDKSSKEPKAKPKSGPKPTSSSSNLRPKSDRSARRSSEPHTGAHQVYPPFYNTGTQYPPATLSGYAYYPMGSYTPYGSYPVPPAQPLSNPMSRSVSSFTDVIRDFTEATLAEALQDTARGLRGSLAVPRSNVNLSRSRLDSGLLQRSSSRRGYESVDDDSSDEETEETDETEDTEDTDDSDERPGPSKRPMRARSQSKGSRPPRETSSTRKVNTRTDKQKHKARASTKDS